MVFLLSFCSVHAAFAHSGAASNGDLILQRIRLSPDRAELRQLRALDYDIAGVDLHNNTVDVLVPRTDSGTFSGMAHFVVQETLPVRLQAPDRGYKTPAQISTILHAYAEKYPKLTRLESIGKSLEGRDIWALKIATPSRDAAKPAILFNGEHHAREVMAPEVVLDTADYLLTRYGKDDQVTGWVDNTDIWLVPMVNPDGSNIVWTRNSYWRKNARDGHGVDINRNYPYAWNSCNGSSSDPSAQDYHGKEAASEPETRALMGFVSRIQPVFNISYHSYSELVLYPYGCRGQRTETQQVVEPLAKKIAALLPSETGRGTYTAGTGWDLLYATDGLDMDWMYHAEHVIAYTIELTSTDSGFHPPYSRRDPTVQAVRPAWQLLLDRLQQSGIRGNITARASVDEPAPLVRVVSTAHKGDSAFDQTWQVKRDGTYHFVLNPGTYKVIVSQADHTVEKTIKVSRRRVTHDVNLDINSSP